MQHDRLERLQRLIRPAFVGASLLATTDARADEDQTIAPEPKFVRARFASTAPIASVERAVCALRPVSMVDARGRELDMQLATRRCRPGAMPEDAVAVVVKVEQADGGSYVVLEAEVPADAALDDLRSAVTDTGFELKQLLEHPAPAPVYGPTPAPEMETKTVWYGVQTLAVDGISAGACATLFGIFIGVPGLIIGAPIVHWAHGHVGIGFASLGMRVGMAGGAGGIGAAIGAGIAAGCGNHSCDSAPAIGGVIGTIVGGLGAIALDAIYLAYEEKQVPKAVRLFPSVGPVFSAQGLGGVTGGVVGVF